MDKIMIDGVDVSECKFRCKDNSCLASYNEDALGAYLLFCNEIKDCYYKQLKRKEKECEILKKENKVLLDRLCKYEEDGDVQVALFSDINRYEQALQEIKEIIHNPPKDKYLEDCILQIIQKVKEQ